MQLGDGTASDHEKEFNTGTWYSLYLGSTTQLKEDTKDHRVCLDEMSRAQKSTPAESRLLIRREEGKSEGKR